MQTSVIFQMAAIVATMIMFSCGYYVTVCVGDRFFGFLLFVSPCLFWICFFMGWFE